jgi:hypothetical protein
VSRSRPRLRDLRQTRQGTFPTASHHCPGPRYLPPTTGTHATAASPPTGVRGGRGQFRRTGMLGDWRGMLAAAGVPGAKIDAAAVLVVTGEENARACWVLIGAPGRLIRKLRMSCRPGFPAHLILMLDLAAMAAKKAPLLPRAGAPCDASTSGQPRGERAEAMPVACPIGRRSAVNHGRSRARHNSPDLRRRRPGARRRSGRPACGWKCEWPPEPAVGGSVTPGTGQAPV